MSLSSIIGDFSATGPWQLKSLLIQLIKRYQLFYVVLFFVYEWCLFSCDCVGILKERNVDVEHKLKSATTKGRKKNPKCRLVFRTVVELNSGRHETIQVASDSICCCK